jgi:hypothetical protein
MLTIIKETLRSTTGIDFDKIYIFCDKCYVYTDKYVFIVIKIKYVNLNRINNIYNTVNCIIKLHIFYNT